MKTETHYIRLATEADAPALERLIHLSVQKLQAHCYSLAQMDAAMGAVFGVDRQLIRDGTYFVIEHDSMIIGCGGWSRRKAVFGGDRDRVGESELIDPQTEPARIRAFFVHPDWARRGVGSAILRACEKAIRAAGFDRITMVATLAGEPLYARFGYGIEERYEVPMRDGLTLPVLRMSKHLPPMIHSDISKATIQDVPDLLTLVNDCVAAMRAAGIEQWDEIYPNANNLTADIAASTLDVLRVGGVIVACITVDQNDDPMWHDLNWSADSEPAAAVHRLMVHPSQQRRGLAKQLMLHAEVVARAKGYRSIRLDTFLQNPAAMALYPRLGYRPTGTAMMCKGEFAGFEKLL
jgi:GNAT superfamily N-acetyltransferase